MRLRAGMQKRNKASAASSLRRQLVRRDAVDVALSTSYGPVRLNQMTVWADEIHPTCGDEHEREESRLVCGAVAPREIG